MISVGSSETGSGSSLVDDPHSIGASPRRKKASPMVAMMMPKMGLPTIVRSTVRSTPTPSRIIAAAVSGRAMIVGRPYWPSIAAARNPANITISPWAKFTMPVAL